MVNIVEQKVEIKQVNIFERFINWLHLKLSDKQFLIFSSLLVGISSGIAGVVLKSFVHFIKQFLVQGYLSKFSTAYLHIFLPIIGIGITVLLIKRFYGGELGKGSPFIMNSIAKKGSFLPFHHMYAHIFTSGITVGFGGSAGLESPIVNTGAAIGSNYARTYKLSYRERTLLLAAGVSGGIAGAFNAPIAGVLFALEVLLIDINLSAFIPLLIASAGATLMSKIILDENILLFFQLKQTFNYQNLHYYVVLAILCGVCCMYYARIFTYTEKLFSGIKTRFNRWIIGGLLLAMLIMFFPSLYSEGYESIVLLSELNPADLFEGSIISGWIKGPWLMLGFIILTLLLKGFATAITLGSGGNGGNFAPSLFVGAHLGFAFAYLLELLGFEKVPVGNLTIVAMAGLLSGIFHAPLTAIFLIAEITGGYDLIIPLMIVSSLSFVISRYFRQESMDIAKLKQMGTIVSEDKDTSILGKIEIQKLIETDYTILTPDNSLGEIVESIKHAKRNIFPVVDKDGNFLGLISLDVIKEDMFNRELYNRVRARELMQKQTIKITHTEDIFSIMKKFDESGQWNLPVTENGKYLGFLSKSGILSEYREQLLSSI